MILGFEHNFDMYEEPLLTDKKNQKDKPMFYVLQSNIRPGQLWSYETVTIRIRNNSEPF